jgi:ketosteroid isomerase-like protein
VTSFANLAFVRSIYAAWERGDYSSVEWAHPEIEIERRDGPEPGRWKGLAAMSEGMRDWASPWEDYRVWAEEFRALDAERVFVLIRRTGRGMTSGLELGQLGAKGAGVFHVRDGRVTRFVAYYDCDRALADLGLAPEADSTT